MAGKLDASKVMTISSRDYALSRNVDLHNYDPFGIEGKDVTDLVKVAPNGTEAIVDLRPVMAAAGTTDTHRTLFHKLYGTALVPKSAELKSR